MPNKKETKARATMWNNITEAIKAVQKELVPAEEIYIPRSHQHLFPKNTNLPGVRILFGGDEAYVRSVPPYREVRVKFDLPIL